MPKSRSKNKHIRTFSLSGQTLARIASEQKPWENKSQAVERLISAQLDFIDRFQSGNQPQNAPEAHWERDDFSQG